MLDLYQEMKRAGRSRRKFLHEAAKIPGIYVPSLYQVEYKEDGTIASFTPVDEEIPATVTKQLVMDMTDAVYPEKPVVPFIKATQDRVVFLRFSAAVSAAAVSARREWCTVRCARKY